MGHDVEIIPYFSLTLLCSRLFSDDLVLEYVSALGKG